MAMIEAQQLSKCYAPPAAKRWFRKSKEPARTFAVDQVSFTVDKGELFVIMGLSGSGKSTLLRMLNRLVEPTSGSVTLDGKDFLALDDDALRQTRNRTVSMVFQHYALLPHRTVAENTALGLSLRGTSAQERQRRAKEALEIVGLGDWGHVYPSQLSGGMRQRVGLARALATDAEILLMDEPFSALDPIIRRDMQDLLLRLQAEMQKTIVFVTHDLNEAMRLGDRIMVMRDGGVVQLGTAQEILTHPADDYVANFVSDVDRSRVVTVDLVMREPLITATIDETPQDVLRRLELAQTGGIYVLDANGVVEGVAHDPSLAKAIRSGATTLDGLLTQDFESVTEDARLIDLFTRVGKHAVPLAVVDSERRLIGVVPRAALLTALADREEAVHA
ncbi:quaternary amine ABC transporter ATP-binding protein [Streptomyces albicerus]|uniref:quaternary amine ABC transporter ATP-binding protein n=1 Tax=Streptomyces albicerus TaxID=2569859 RepID=UPI001CED3CA3|nr:betaine/proline/choline family ABC transporter ATP-binding protein [Streptomyces albicerus]